MIRIILYIFAFLSAVYLFTVKNKVSQIPEKIKKNTSIVYASPIKTNKALLSLAKSKLGSPYVYAKAGPKSFDCSGFVYYLFKEHNISVARTSLAQSQEGEKLTKNQIKKGDILFFDTSLKGHINHSGIYLGEGKFIHASSGKAMGVTISDLNTWYKDKFRWGIRKVK